MSKIPINEENVKDVLKNKQKLINSIHTKMKHLNSDIRNKNDIIVSVSLQSKQLSDMPKSFGNFKDISDVYETYIRRLEKQKLEFQNSLWNLIEEEEMIERVWLCFMAIDEPCFGILESMYVRGEKYEFSLSDSGLSNKAFNEKRREGIRTILRLYYSDIDEFQLEHIIKDKEQRNELKKHTENNDSGQQITIFMSVESDE